MGRDSETGQLLCDTVTRPGELAIRTDRRHTAASFDHTDIRGRTRRVIKKPRLQPRTIQRDEGAMACRSDIVTRDASARPGGWMAPIDQLKEERLDSGSKPSDRLLFES